MDDLPDLLTYLAPVTDSETIATVRDVSVAYAAGKVDLETYTQILGALYSANCMACGDRRWRFEVPRSDGEGATNLCGTCYWRLAQGEAEHKLLVERLRSGNVIEFEYGLLVRELIAAFNPEWSSVAYAEGGRALAVMCAPIEQTCDGVTRVPGEAVRACGFKTTASVCVNCGGRMTDIQAGWQELVVKAEARVIREGPTTTENEGDGNDD